MLGATTDALCGDRLRWKRCRELTRPGLISTRASHVGSKEATCRFVGATRIRSPAPADERQPLAQREDRNTASDFKDPRKVTLERGDPMKSNCVIGRVSGHPEYEFEAGVCDAGSGHGHSPATKSFSSTVARICSRRNWSTPRAEGDCCRISGQVQTVQDRVVADGRDAPWRRMPRRRCSG